ncbi:MAG: NAD(P)H-binding protein [Burkholderiales bacterium]|nr:NAD(P)H-binding protein [Burkholderiales bacterium]
MSRFEKIAILGATGPTGKHLAREWLRRGAAVRVVSRSALNLARAFGAGSVERVAADALDGAAIRRALAGCDAVFDCIGLPLERIRDHPPTARNAVEAARETGARLVHVSSYWAYIPIVRTPLAESHPRTGGGLAVRMRREAEDIMQAGGAAVVNLPDFYGPEVHLSILNRALEQATAGRTVEWIGSARTAREHVYVPDAMCTIAEIAQREAAYGERWIVPGAGPIDLDGMRAIVQRHLGREVRVRSAGRLAMTLLALLSRDVRALLALVPTYVAPIAYDGSKLRGLIGAIRATPYATGIPATLDWIAGRAPAASG